MTMGSFVKIDNEAKSNVNYLELKLDIADKMIGWCSRRLFR